MFLPEKQGIEKYERPGKWRKEEKRELWEDLFVVIHRYRQKVLKQVADAQRVFKGLCVERPRLSMSRQWELKLEVEGKTHCEKHQAAKSGE